MPGESGPRRALGALAACVVASVVAAACAPSPALPDTGNRRAAAAVRDAGAAARDTAAADAAVLAMAAPRIDEAAARVVYAGARTYSGALLCADCPTRRLTLTIFPDGTFRMLEVDEEGAGLRVVHDVGRWSASADAADTIVLHGDTQGTRLLRRVAPDGLAIVDNEGREIRGLGNATLSRAPQVDPLPGPLRLVGHYLREDGEPVFVDCLTGRRLPVIDAAPASGAPQAARQLAAARAALDDAQQAIGDSPGAPVLAVVRGYLVPQGGPPGGSGGEALVVAAFDRAMRAGRCEDFVRRAP
ncbi:MAG: copper resistance protein NlpE N-terminal domain-containing protein [Burkholderiaceae bacterium]|nr:copper resistance protein NlpE N-terminal domain-containing protein [Burkholderiaceae bacterium]